MIRLDLSAGPYWLDLGHGVRLHVLPMTTSVMAAARGDAALAALPDDAGKEQMAITLAKAVARLVVTDWEGVGDGAGKPVPVTPGGIEALLDLWPVFEAFQVRYLARQLMLEQEKKRLRALAEWRFGGGERYCAACEGPCPDCPARLNRPQTVEGWQAWDLVLRLGGQLRAIPGAVLGWDMGAALAMARALGIEPVVAAEFLPEIEAVMVPKLNARIEDGRDG